MRFGIWELIIILVIILLLFGTKKLRNAGGDLGAAMKNFKKAVKDEENKAVEDKSDKDANFSDDKAKPQSDKEPDGR